jgi:LPXTG-site transpeptidase (sortase) family protein
MNNNKGIILGCILIAIGISIVSYNYIGEKKENAYLKMNIELYDSQTPEIIYNEEIEITEYEKEEETIRVEEASSSNSNIVNTYYAGVLEIEKIGLKRGFVDINSKENNINQNVTVLKESTFPDEENSNLILAAHSGTAYISFFNKLYLLNNGDIASIYYKQKKYNYRIISIYTQPKIGKLAIIKRTTKNTLTLITCTNNDSTTQTVYIAELID